MTGIIILAAGSSSRLGRPKQNVVYNGNTLLQNTINAALATNCEKIIVVLGANNELILPTIQHFKITIIHNTDWQEGMASSIRLGLASLLDLQPNTQQVIFTVCDQPYLSPEVLNGLIVTQNQTKAKIVASNYGKHLGVPVLFLQSYFNELMQLKGDEGAKKLVNKYHDEVKSYPFLKGEVDIDSLDDLERLGSLKITTF
jgi:molybdenum cofactor cytidylyltransferase